MSTAPTSKPPIPFGIFFAVFIFIFALIVGGVVAYTAILPRSYRSCAIIEVRQKDTGERKPTALGYNLTKNESVIISSEVLLRKVIADLNLNEKWGEKYFNGQTLKTWESLEILKQRVITFPIPETTLIAIGIYGENPNEAAFMANAVATNYVNYIFTNSPNLTSQFVDKAVIEKIPVRPNVTRNTVIGVMVGIIVGGASGIASALLVYKKNCRKLNFSSSRTSDSEELN